MNRYDAIQEANHYYQSSDPRLFKNGEAHRDTLLAKAFWEGFSGESFTGQEGAWYESFFYAGKAIRNAP